MENRKAGDVFLVRPADVQMSERTGKSLQDDLSCLEGQILLEIGDCLLLSERASVVGSYEVWRDGNVLLKPWVGREGLGEYLFTVDAGGGGISGRKVGPYLSPPKLESGVPRAPA